MEGKADFIGVGAILADSDWARNAIENI